MLNVSQFVLREQEGFSVCKGHALSPKDALFPEVQLIQHVQTSLGSLDFVKSSSREISPVSSLRASTRGLWLGLEITLPGIWGRENGLLETCSAT